MNKLKQLGRENESENYQIRSSKAKHVVILNNKSIFLKKCNTYNDIQIILETWRNMIYMRPKRKLATWEKK